MLLLSIVSLGLLAYLIFFIPQFVNVIFRGYAPFVPTDSETIRKIISELGTDKPAGPAVIYELGCGPAEFLRQAEKSWPRARLIGVENLFSLYLINKIRLKLQGSQIRLLPANIFSVDLKDADLIYCYLNNAAMARLGEKFAQECRSGTRIVSRSFPMPQFRPEQVLTVRHKKIFFYRI